MQDQARGYTPPSTVRVKGIKKGSKQVKGGRKPTARQRTSSVNNTRKTSPYSKNRSGVKTTQIAPGYKSMMLGNPLGRQPVVSNNSPGFNFPGAVI